MLKKHRKVRKIIFLFDIFTLVVFILVILAFLFKNNNLVPDFIVATYLTLLTAYVTSKEIRRYQKKYISQKRRGEYFVFLWIFLLIILLLWGILGGFIKGYALPNSLPTIVGTAFILYIITEYLKGDLI